MNKIPPGSVGFTSIILYYKKSNIVDIKNRKKCEKKDYISYLKQL